MDAHCVYLLDDSAGVRGMLGIDLDPARLALARQFGAGVVDLAKCEDPLAAAAAFSRGRGKDANDIIDAQDDVLDYHTFQLGTLVDLVDDAKASDGKAAPMTGATDQWATRYVLEEDARVLAKGLWHWSAR